MRRTWVVGMLGIAAWLWLFRAPLFLGEVCALRDAGNFYYPLFAWESAEWGAGRIPLWNPYDGLGVPVLADATSSVLYPGKLIFALPFSFGLRFTLYIAGHVLVAAGTLFWLARRWGASDWAAGVGAMSYAFGGYVLFQHCNPVFLVSAAWLPLAIWLAEEMLVNKSSRAALGMGAVLALMTLGGDPQTACHAGILATVYALLLWHRERSAAAKKTASESVSRAIRAGIPRPALLALSAVTAFGLAAVQVLPTWQWTRHSDRAQFETPRNIYEVAGRLLFQNRGQDAQAGGGQRSFKTEIFARHPSNSHAARMYHYSLGPWRLAEIGWPNISGRMYPIHRRWMSDLPGEHTVWTPTLYMGLIPLLAAIAAWRFGTSLRDRWLKWMVGVGVFGSFGWYGLGWILHQLHVSVTGNAAASEWIGQPVGGLYWLLVTLLPGYAYFRYPGKWFVMAALGCSLLAARGTDQWLTGDVRLRWMAKYFSFCNLFCLAVLLLGKSQLIAWFQQVSASELYGPFDAQGAWFDMLTGVFVVSIESVFLWLMMRSERWRMKLRWAPWLLALTCLDLLLANQWLVATVPGSVFERPSQTVMQLRSALPMDSQVPPRILHALSAFELPRRWIEQRDDDRLTEIVAWERDALLHRHHLPFGITVLDAPTTIRSAEWLKFLQVSPRTPNWASGRVGGSDFVWLGLDFWVERPPAIGAKDPIKLIENIRKRPRVWLATNGAQSATAQSATPAQRGGDHCKIVRYEPQLVEVHVQLTSPATLVLSDAFDPNWQVTCRDHGSNQNVPVTVEKFRGLVRSVALPPGEHVVVFRIRSYSLLWGATISAISWLVLGMGSIRCQVPANLTSNL